jgi:hypothetical protein
MHSYRIWLPSYVRGLTENAREKRHSYDVEQGETKEMTKLMVEYSGDLDEYVYIIYDVKRRLLI